MKGAPNLATFLPASAGACPGDAPGNGKPGGCVYRGDGWDGPDAKEVTIAI